MWKETKKKLTATFTFEDFAQAFAFMVEVAFHAEKHNHHPTWTNTYNTVDIELTTHDAGNTVTEKDKKLADTIENLYKKYQSGE